MRVVLTLKKEELGIFNLNSVP